MWTQRWDPGSPMFPFLFSYASLAFTKKPYSFTSYPLPQKTHFHILQKISLLVRGWPNPIWKNLTVKLDHFLKESGLKIKTSNLKPPPSDVWSYPQIMVPKIKNNHKLVPRLTISHPHFWKTYSTLCQSLFHTQPSGLNPLGPTAQNLAKKKQHKTQGLSKEKKDWWKCLFYFYYSTSGSIYFYLMWIVDEPNFPKKMPHDMFIIRWSLIPESWYISEKLIWILKWARKKDPLTFHYTACFIRDPYIGLW